MKLFSQKAIAFASILIGILIGFIVLIVFINPFGLLLLASIGISIAHPADHSTYEKYVAEAQNTKDITVTRECGNITLEAVHTDKAIPGKPATIDQPVTPPILEQIYILNGYKDGKQLFSTYNGDKWPDVHLDSFAAYSGTYVSGIAKAYIFDRNTFTKFTSKDQRTDLPGNLVYFSTAASVSDADLGLFASCYANNKSSLDTVLDAPVIGFIKEVSSPVGIRKLTCSSGNFLTIEDSLIRLNGVTENIIGTIREDGTFLPFTGIGDPNFDSKNAVPPEQRNIMTWNSCVTSSGQTLEQYIQERSNQVIYL